MERHTLEVHLVTKHLVGQHEEGLLIHASVMMSSQSAAVYIVVTELNVKPFGLSGYKCVGFLKKKAKVRLLRRSKIQQNQTYIYR